MNNGYKSNLSLGNYTIENKEKLEFQTHGFTGDPEFVPIIIYYRTNQCQITEKGFIFCFGNQNSNWVTDKESRVYQT